MRHSEHRHPRCRAVTTDPDKPWPPPVAHLWKLDPIDLAERIRCTLCVHTATDWWLLKTWGSVAAHQAHQGIPDYGSVLPLCPCHLNPKSWTPADWTEVLRAW